MIDLGGLWIALWKEIEERLQKMLVTPQGGVGIVHQIDGGNAVEVERMENVERLRALCLEAVNNPGWVAHDITGDGKNETFCNRSTRFIAEGMGYFGFDRNDTANMMLAKMAADPATWTPIGLHKVTGYALKGALVILGAEDHPNGHVTAAAPEPAEASGSWGMEVPMVAHVGGGDTPNGIVRLSQAYKLKHQPRMMAFVLESSIA